MNSILASVASRNSTAWRTKPSAHRIVHSTSGLGADYQPSLV